MLAYQAVERASRMREAETRRLERLAEWRDARLRANRMYDQVRSSALRNRARHREGLLFRVPSFYEG